MPAPYNYVVKYNHERKEITAIELDGYGTQLVKFACYFDDREMTLGSSTCLSGKVEQCHRRLQAMLRATEMAYQYNALEGVTFAMDMEWNI